MYINIKRMALLLVAAATMLTAACSKENKESSSEISTFTAAKAELNYKIALNAEAADALAIGYDAIIDYYDSDGTIKTSSALNANNLTWEKNVTRTSFPASVGFRVRFVPKNDLGGVTEDEKFYVEGTVSVIGACTSINGRKAEILKSRFVQKSGINPHNGRTYTESMQHEIKTDGNCEVRGGWPE